MLAQYHVAGKRVRAKRNIRALRNGAPPRPENRRALTADKTLGLLRVTGAVLPVPCTMPPGHWHKHRPLGAKGQFPDDLP